nr:serine/threonine-protein kinase D2 [Pelodiscus sinensis]|eukprot:XP_025038657.1 serine/threonine-protein kinase D2 [Pelodiscus sinensis]
MASPPACAGPPALPSSPSTPGGCLATPELASLPPGSCAACQGVSFHIQIGLTREFVLLPAASDLAHVKQLACSIVDQKFPECGFYGLYDKILLFKHDLSSANILQLVRVAGDIQEGDLVEVVLSGNTCFPECGFYGLYDKILLFKHDLSSANILQLVRVAGDIQEGDLVEVVLSECGFYGLYDKILLFKHDLSSANILQLVRVAGDIQEGDLVEVVLSDVPMEDVSDLSDADKNSLMDESDDSGIIPGSHSENELRGGDDPDDDASKSQGSMGYIPLMRVVQSVRHTNRKSSTALKEGWMVHYSSKDTLGKELPGQKGHIPEVEEVEKVKSICRSQTQKGIKITFNLSLKSPDAALRNPAPDRKTTLSSCSDLEENLSQCPITERTVTLGQRLKERPDAIMADVPWRATHSRTRLHVQWAMEKGRTTPAVAEKQNSLPGLYGIEADSEDTNGNRRCQVCSSARAIGRANSTGGGCRTAHGLWLQLPASQKAQWFQSRVVGRALSQNNPSSRYYKEIPLSEILAVELAQNFTPVLPGANLHCFEIVTANATYYVGENCAPAPCSASQQHSGVGLEVATAWENAIRQALMPVILQDAPSAQGQAPHRQASLRISVSNSQIEENVVSISSRSRSLCIERKREQTGQEEYKRITQNQRSPGHKTSYIPQATERELRRSCTVTPGAREREKESAGPLLSREGALKTGASGRRRLACLFCFSGFGKG